MMLKHHWRVLKFYLHVVAIFDTPQNIICAVYKYTWCSILKGYNSYNENDICQVEGKTWHEVHMTVPLWFALAKDLPVQDNSLSLQALHTHPTSTSDNKINSALHWIQELWITKKTYLYLWMADLCATRRLWHTWHKAWRTCGSSDWSTANNKVWTRDNSFSISTHCSRTCNYTNKFLLTDWHVILNMTYSRTHSPSLM